MPTTATTMIIDGFTVYKTDACADVLCDTFGHIYVDPDDKALRFITPHGSTLLFNSLRDYPRAVVGLLGRIERVADSVFPDDPDVTWVWDLPAKDLCPCHVC